MKKVLFVATVVRKHINVFHVPYLKMFKDMGWETSVCARNDYDEKEDCIIPFCDHYYDMTFERTPIKKNNYNVYKKLKKLIETEKYDIIHCHTPVGGLLTRLAARKERKNGTSVIYTAHGFHFYKGAPICNWLFYYPVEWLCSWFTDCLITINKEDYELAKKKMHSKKVEYVRGVGIDTRTIKNIKVNREEKLKEFGIKDEMVFLSVGELNNNKNQEVIIKALSKVKFDFRYLLCGKGDKQPYLEQLANDLGIGDKVIFTGYRNDIKELLHCTDVFCFPSFREGLSVALMEAMAAGLPCVVSKIRGNVDLIHDGVNGFLCNPASEDDFYNAIVRLCGDAELQKKMHNSTLEFVKGFDKAEVMEKIRKIYL